MKHKLKTRLKMCMLVYIDVYSIILLQVKVIRSFQ